ncbi:MAG: DUF3024 domain-containing protein [Lentimonas sp.]
MELFFARPSFSDSKVKNEESIAKITYVQSKAEWQIYWKRASEKWSRYTEAPNGLSLSKALQVIDKDPNYCFFG